MHLIRLNFSILTKPNTRNETSPMFLCITPEMIAITERVYWLTLDLERIPPIGLKQFFMTYLKEKIKTTNDVEDVHSTRKEIKHAIDQLK